jgi:hypothetical protein
MVGCLRRRRAKEKERITRFKVEMKERLLRLVLLLGAVALFPAPDAAAIPQSFGAVVTGPFLDEVGVPAEDYFNDEEGAWSAHADLPGAWEKVDGRPSVARLKLPGPVFGVHATAMETRRSADGELVEVLVSFVPKDCKMSSRELLAVVRKRLVVFTGGGAGDGKKYATERMVIRLRSGANGVVQLRFTKP